MTTSNYLIVLCLVIQSMTSIGEETAAHDGLPWVSRDGKTIWGRYLGMTDDEVRIERNGTTVRLPFKLLSDESILLAKAGKFQPLFTGVKKGLLTESRAGLLKKHVDFGSFTMGSPPKEPGREDNETQHRVWIRRDIEMKSAEVTRAEWNAVRQLAENYGYTDMSTITHHVQEGGSGLLPVVGISWWDAVKWCNLLSQIEDKRPVYYSDPGFAAKDIFKNGRSAPHVDWKASGYRLPTEAEWEYACRHGNSKQPFHTARTRKNEDMDGQLDAAGWYRANSNGRVHPVLGKEPNDFHLHDMHGNAAEWCWDLAGPLGTAEVFNPLGAKDGDKRIVRGGSWCDSANQCRAAYRGTPQTWPSPDTRSPAIGFRTVRLAEASPE